MPNRQIGAALEAAVAFKAPRRQADYRRDVSPQIDPAAPGTETTHDATMAFRHLLHEVASHVTGLGLTLEMLGEPGLTADDTATMVTTARVALDDLRRLVGDVGELTRFLHRHGAIRAETLTARDVLAELADPAPPPAAVPPPPDAVLDAPLRADRVVVSFVMRLLARSCRRLPGVAVAVSASAVSEDAVRIELTATYTDRSGGRRSLEKAPLVVDHFCALVARDLDGTFFREQSPAGQRVGFVLAVATSNDGH
jgi:hypothetical protein